MALLVVLCCLSLFVVCCLSSSCVCVVFLLSCSFVRVCAARHSLSLFLLTTLLFLKLIKHFPNANKHFMLLVVVGLCSVIFWTMKNRRKRRVWWWCVVCMFEVFIVYCFKNNKKKVMERTVSCLCTLFSSYTVGNCRFFFLSITLSLTLERLKEKQKKIQHTHVPKKDLIFFETEW